MKTCKKCNIEKELHLFISNKDICKECSKKCIHNIRLEYCLVCKNGGVSMCIHKRRKNRCTECNNGSQLCEHKREKYDCKDCNSKGICAHNIKEKEYV